ncbi:MAG: Bacterial type II secretion system protein F domain protein [Methanocella sp. PtaU1.Bin125]|nr:MAG: Bacterial type II secretion system protein F domain protein [Methanocella sp. PtaU1.Bin125]
MIAFGETDGLRATIKAAGMPGIVTAAVLAGACLGGVTMLLQPFYVAVYVFLMTLLAPAAVAYSLMASYDSEINGRAPELFYDLSEYVRASGSMPKALKRAAAGHYGAMSDEVRRVLSEIEDEGFDLASSLRAMAGRVKNAYVTRSVTIINEALTSSPDAESVLKMVAAEGRLSRSLEAERRAGISPAITVMYLTAAVFLIVVSLCISSFVPVSRQLGALAAGGAVTPENPVDYAMPYYALSLSVTVCTGLTIGAMRDNSIFGGMKDAAVLTTAAFLVFALIVFPGVNLMGAIGL